MRLQEQHGGALGLSQVQYVFLELPKYASGGAPQGTIDRWAYFFREAENLEVVPPALSEPPFREALEVARMAGFSAGELDLYDRAKIAEQDARGALSLARVEEAARALLTVLRARGIAVPDAVRERILAQKDAERLERWLEKAAVAVSVAEVIDETS
jgi:PD-(D/E)XK nuclease family transposase